MAITIHQIKRWYLILSGKSIWHVNQNIGKYFQKNNIKGYYNNMIEKVTRMPELLAGDELPKLDLEGGKSTVFPVAIFQYGLGAYDLYLKTCNECYASKFMQCVNWAIEHKDEKGSWNNFSHYCPDTPYSAMAQGEGVSLLIRAYKHTGKADYLDAARNALEFMLLPLTDGGTTKYEGDDMYLMEYTFKGMVLNGSIFSWWGLYDYVLVTKDVGRYKDMMDRTLKTLIKILPEFKCSFWSIYSLDGLIASPFYHNLHIAQMQAMYQLTGEKIFEEYATYWGRQQKNPFCRSLAFIKKAFQKIIEKR